MNDLSPNDSLTVEESLEIKDKVHTGEYFREARSMYDLTIHDPMSERYLFTLITGLATLALLIAFIGMRGLYPLQTDVPFAFDSTDLVNDVPHIRSLLDYKGEDPNEALLRFLTNNYVNAYESYDIEIFDRNIGGVRSQSTDEVYAKYQQLITPRNPDSPLALYQRHSTRKIKILSSTRLGENNMSMEVVYEAFVTSKTDIKKTLWQANISFNYKGLELDEDTGKVIPFEFMVTNYRNKRLQDVR